MQKGPVSARCAGFNLKTPKAPDRADEFRQARPAPHTRSQRLQRLDYLDPLTTSKNYRDPSPVVIVEQTGDRYGHRD